MVRVCPSVGVQDSSESMSFLKVDQRKKQLTLYEPSLLTQPILGHRRAPLAAPKMFAFDAIFTQDASQVKNSTGICANCCWSCDISNAVVLFYWLLGCILRHFLKDICTTHIQTPPPPTHAYVWGVMQKWPLDFNTILHSMGTAAVSFKSG